MLYIFSFDVWEWRKRFFEKCLTYTKAPMGQMSKKLQLVFRLPQRCIILNLKKKMAKQFKEEIYNVQLLTNNAKGTRDNNKQNPIAIGYLTQVT